MICEIVATAATASMFRIGLTLKASMYRMQTHNGIEQERHISVLDK
jgi:hypothetical protein